MVHSDFRHFASANVCRCLSSAWLLALRAQVFEAIKVVVKDWHRQSDSTILNASADASLTTLRVAIFFSQSARSHGKKTSVRRHLTMNNECAIKRT